MSNEAKLTFFISMYKYDGEKTVKVNYLDFKTELGEKFRKVGKGQIEESIETELLENLDSVDICLLTVHCDESSEFEFVKIFIDLVVKYNSDMALHNYFYEMHNLSAPVQMKGVVTPYSRL